ncbi:MAG: T9SS type A sorting domain-containing protein, partial [Bacteroidetes bacterium]|nr:T9SS type A sorting domain-containing protein [Bacteroidota bacterium]
SCFEFTLLIEGVRYDYGFSATQEHVHDEWIITYKGNKEVTWLDRSYNAEHDNYEWDFGDGQKSANTNTTHYFLYGGIYAVQLISTNQYGCNDTVIIDVDMTHLGIDEFAHGNLNSLGVYPNPYQDKTEIVYELRENADVSIIVYNILGEEVARLYEGTQPAGQHQIQFSNEKERSATAVVVRNENTSGIYILKMTINESEVYTRRIIKSR